MLLFIHVFGYVVELIVSYRLVHYSYIAISNYRKAQNSDGGKFWHFWCFPARPSNCLKNNTALQVCGERQWLSVKIFSVKYLKSQYLSKFPPVKILRYTVVRDDYLFPYFLLQSVLPFSKSNFYTSCLCLTFIEYCKRGKIHWVPRELFVNI